MSVLGVGVDERGEQGDQARIFVVGLNPAKVVVDVQRS